MATKLSAIITQVRDTLNESTANFWTDAELLRYATDGCRDLWRAIIDLHQGHFLVIDETNVSLAANTNLITGVPTGLFRVELIEVRDLSTANAVQNLTFWPRTINHPDFSAARGLGAVSPSGQNVYFAVFNAGAPVAAPSIEVAPQLASAVPLRLVYTPVLEALTTNSDNPIPGESDHAVYAWTVAHARARERPKGDPDPEFMAFYATDKNVMLTALTPRQVQEPDTSEGLFEAYW